jgi:hypothetical protein
MLLTGVGCAGTGNSVEGHVQGAPLTARGAVASAQLPGPGFLTITIADYGIACDDPGYPNAINPNSTVLTFSLTNSAGTPGTGSYNAAPTATGSTSVATFTQWDIDCNANIQATAVSGTVTLSSVTQSAVSGSFDVTFPDSLTGSFDAALCPSNDADAGAGGVPTCFP